MSMKPRSVTWWGIYSSRGKLLVSAPTRYALRCKHCGETVARIRIIPLKKS